MQRKKRHPGSEPTRTGAMVSSSFRLKMPPLSSKNPHFFESTLKKSSDKPEKHGYFKDLFFSDANQAGVAQG
jgi:hypothetical protein